MSKSTKSGYHGAANNKPNRKFVVLGEIRTDKDQKLQEIYSMLPVRGWTGAAKEDKSQVEGMLKRIYLEGFKRDFIAFNLYDIYGKEVPPELAAPLFYTFNAALEVNKAQVFESLEEFKTAVKKSTVH